MGFIRSYAAQSMGDPFSLRVPKKLRKLKVGRALGKVARAAVGFVPGLGQLSNLVLSPALQKLSAKYPQVPPDVWDGFARAYGLDMGDPGHPPVKTTSRRKSAGAGPKAKAKNKAQVRAQRAGRPQTHPAPKGKGPSLGGAVSATADAIGHLNAFGVSADDIASILGGGKNILHPGGSAGGMRGPHRRINPTNVKALNRSLRRVEGFEKLVKRVMGHKLFKRVRGGAHHAGHRAGCRCVACKKRG